MAISGNDAVPQALALGDLNADGKIDVVVGRVEARSTAFINIGNGSAFAPVDFGDNKGTIYGLAIGDLDGDGSADIAAARSDAPSTVYFGGME